MSYQTTSTPMLRRLCAVAAVILVAMVSVLASSLPTAQAATTDSAAGQSSPRTTSHETCGWFYGWYYDSYGFLRYGWYLDC